MGQHDKRPLRHVTINGGTIATGESYRLTLPPTRSGYADAQLDDYGAGNGRRHYPYRPGTTLSVRARFSHEAEQLQGTAGFGFWNAPYGDPTVKWPSWPQAVWFFLGAPPNALPFLPDPPAPRWSASTLNAATGRGWRWLPLAPAVALLNNIPAFKRRVWPRILRDLGVSVRPLPLKMRDWHTYRLEWLATGCRFWVNGRLLHHTRHTPHSPLGFVAWIDNQYLIAQPNGRFSWGVLATPSPQWLELAELTIKTAVA